MINGSDVFFEKNFEPFDEVSENDDPDYEQKVI